MILVDSNVLIDLVSANSVWADWSRRQLNRAAAQDDLAVNDIVYAELSVRYRRIEDLEAFVLGSGLVLASIPRHALFLAGKAFERYRAAGGVRTGVLPDFFIGAHAAVTRSPLITRDARRYRSYFPGIALITPDPAP